MAYNQIQLFALNIPTQLTLPFELYALEVPPHWKELFTRLQEIKLERKPVLPPIECLNHYLQIIVEDLIFRKTSINAGSQKDGVFVATL